jgi:hypothetical protein
MIIYPKPIVGGKTYSYNDSKGKYSPEKIGLTRSFWGGNCSSVCKTAEGFYMVVNDYNQVLGIVIPDIKEVTPEGLSLLRKDGKINEPATESAPEEPTDNKGISLKEVLEHYGKNSLVQLKKDELKEVLHKCGVDNIPDDLTQKDLIEWVKDLIK